MTSRAVTQSEIRARMTAYVEDDNILLHEVMLDVVTLLKGIDVTREDFLFQCERVWDETEVEIVGARQ